MRLLEGHSLADRLSGGPLPWEEAAATAARLALVLAAAHERGIVHRDVTPENVLLTPEGAKLLDFGIAAFAGEADDDLVEGLRHPALRGPRTPQGVTRRPGGRRLLPGRSPLRDAQGPPALSRDDLGGHRTGPPRRAATRPGRRPRLPPEIAAVCRRCLSPDPTDRPSAREVAAALLPGEAEREPGWVKWGAAMAGILALGILVSAAARRHPGRPGGGHEPGRDPHGPDPHPHPARPERPRPRPRPVDRRTPGDRRGRAATP